MKSQNNIQWYLILHINFFIYAICSLLGKKAGSYDFLSFGFVIFYALGIVLMAFYAVIWQQAIKHMPLITAYANRAVTVLWGMIFGSIFYKEEFTFRKVISSSLIIGGIILFAKSVDSQEE